ncbi:TonB-dependent hemoglobin/transferrin/lactoferrin family receptor [Chelatococcus asaccharovorans]|uniref:TonB-dependent hemoglobin/transferrin/lactoferrin family receptor n=1 Tax=Chelatococcus asaccharovorans TaxID=28210 RepID=UPI00224C73C5|nr:TonB-dependent hemoglobin/transferrin/lactoferrin family receptor [Chelatococcus asaccharovorans]CAH1672454.1 TonB-dependent hemin, ferrichrome receptor [Chelatococcus asaccharovorans]CAH1676143.1 TonB-dependent hemin, ferrichrome receptor [Chelatococcus asaccharovorans]
MFRATRLQALAFVSLSAMMAAQAEAQAPANLPQPAMTEAMDVVTLDAITITATKTEETVVDTLAGASVVTRADMDRFQASTVSDALIGVPGVVAPMAVNDPGQSINIRGLQDFGRVNVLVDGARQNFQISGHNANGTFYLDPELIGQIDVVRGPVSTIYGSGAIGGVAAFQTRTINDILKPDEKFGMEQKIGFGTNGAGFLNSTSGAVRLGTNADLFGQFVYRNTNSYKDGNGDKIPDTGSELVAGLVKFNIRPADGHQISATAMRQNYDYDNNGTSGAGTRWSNEVETGTYTLGYTFSRPDVPWLDLSIKGYYTETKLQQTTIAPNTTYSALGVEAGDRLSDRIRTLGFDVNNTSRFSTGPVDHALTYGFDSSWDRVKTVDNAGGYVGALTPSGNRRLSGGFIQDELKYNDWLRVLGALRYDNYKLDGGGYESDGSRWSPKFTVGVTPVKGIELYGTYAEGYRAPSITETLIAGTHPFPAFNILPNPNLKPEVARNIEAGVNVKYNDVLKDGDTFRAKANVFRNKIDDYIDMEEVGSPYLVPYIPGMPASVCRRAPQYCMPIYSYQYVNIAQAKITGVEVEAAYDWKWGFMTVAGTVLNGKNEVTGGPLNTVSPNRVSSTLGFRFLDDKLTVGGRLTLVDSTKKTVTNPEAGYGLVDLFASYQYNDDIRGDVVIQNLFDRQYTQYLNSEASAGLTAKFALTVRFASK